MLVSRSEKTEEAFELLLLPASFLPCPAPSVSNQYYRDPTFCVPNLWLLFVWGSLPVCKDRVWGRYDVADVHGGPIFIPEHHGAVESRSSAGRAELAVGGEEILHVGK